MSELIGISSGESLEGMYCAWSGYAYYKLEIDTIDDNGNVVGNLTKNVTAIIRCKEIIPYYYYY